MPNEVFLAAGSANHIAFQTSIERMTMKSEREIQEVAVHVLHDQRERALAEISLARFADCARGRIGPEPL